MALHGIGLEFQRCTTCGQLSIHIHSKEVPLTSGLLPSQLPQELLDFLSPEVIKESEAAAADEGSPSDVTLGSATGRARRSLAAAAKAIAAAHRAATALKAVDEDASTKQAGKELVGQDGKDTPGLALHVEEREGAPSPWVQQPSQFR